MSLMHISTIYFYSSVDLAYFYIKAVQIDFRKQDKATSLDAKRKNMNHDYNFRDQRLMLITISNFDIISINC